ncbi:MAG: hypothetical protein CVU41_07535 [Chloroflexi bacterium HGW-Chloroflexi-3]|nr:MAG: hypothetical protein CVU41_07535 [Chloroflexi bacterium HGW-Chloroflexi-3]
MTEPLEQSNPYALTLSSLGWGQGVVCLVCQNCDWQFLVGTANKPQDCPHCHTNQLEKYQDEDFSKMEDFIKPPELYLPFSFPQEQLNEKIQNFAKNIPFAPDDLRLDNLQTRLQKIYLPMWLVDSHVSATWQSECGYYYQVKSHQEKYSGGRWQTQEVIETRTRWEPRLGRLGRSYQNIAAPALEEHRRLMGALGNYEYKKAQPVTPQSLLQDSVQPPLVNIPSRDKDDAWPDTLPRFQEQAMEESRQACAANQIREFRWKPEFSNQNWTLFLLPMWSSYYLDDENKPQSILVNGQSGQMSGTRRASMKKAKKISLSIFIAALIAFALTVVVGLISLSVQDLAVIAGIGIMISLIIALAAIYPIVTAWNVNRDR